MTTALSFDKNHLNNLSLLRKRMDRILKEVFPDQHAPRTVVVIPSHSLDQEVMAKIQGVHFYEERMLCTLMLLRLPHTQIIYLSSQEIAPAIIDYYLQLLPGIPVGHARSRLTLLTCRDQSMKSLTEKILERPRLCKRIIAQIRHPENAHLTCFNATHFEQELSIRLNIPLYATDPALNCLGTKSGGRKVFQEAGIPIPPGEEGLTSPADIAPALARLKREHPELRRAVVKLEDGFSGEGNAIFPFEGAPEKSGLEKWIAEELPSRLRCEAEGMTWNEYSQKFSEMGGVVEAFLEGKEKTSPSVQFRMDGSPHCTIISTHDQILGGASGQVFLGSRFPAHESYRLQLQEFTQRIGDILSAKGGLGRAGVDYVCVRENGEWKHYAIEINLRKGGTTHPFLMLQFLADGRYDRETGLYFTPSGMPLSYFATDNLQEERYKGLLPKDLIDIVVENGLHFHSAMQQGVVFHLIGALSQYGKLGMVCIGASRPKADALYKRTKNVIEEEVARYADTK